MASGYCQTIYWAETEMSNKPKIYGNGGTDEDNCDYYNIPDQAYLGKDNKAHELSENESTKNIIKRYNSKPELEDFELVDE